MLSATKRFDDAGVSIRKSLCSKLLSFNAVMQSSSDSDGLAACSESKNNIATLPFDTFNIINPNGMVKHKYPFAKNATWVPNVTILNGLILFDERFCAATPLRRRGPVSHLLAAPAHKFLLSLLMTA